MPASRTHKPHPFQFSTILTLIALLVSVSTASAQRTSQPKLVVGIVVDQLRSDYIDKYWHTFGEGGFKRLVEEGYWCKNANYNYVPTHTGPGHASVYTGTTPAVHGIVANNWFDPAEQQVVYCASDSTAKPVGTMSPFGGMSPSRMLTTSVADQLQLATNEASVCIGIALKDRGAILPAGHMADGAYWFDTKTGFWVTSTFYTNELPKWVRDFNALQLPSKYIEKDWDKLLKDSEYKASLPDDNPYEAPFKGKETTTFPYDLEQLASENGGWGLFKTVPGGSTLTREFAQAAITANKMGQDDVTDLLALSFSAPDAVGHRFGIQSVEMEDTYARLDRELAQFFAFLDKEVGAGNFTCFLTADHGAVHVPQYLKDKRVPAGYYSEAEIMASINTGLKAAFGIDTLVVAFKNSNLHFDNEAIRANKLDRVAAEQLTIELLLQQEAVSNAVTKHDMIVGHFVQPPLTNVKRGVHQQRSGDVLVVMKAGWLQYGPQGTSHGTGYAYDTHVPLLWMGAGIEHGSTVRNISITDIAPTVSQMLNIQYPSGCTGQPIPEVLK